VFFDVGPLELIALAVIAMLVLGPDKLPRYAADAARVLRQVRRMANAAKAEMSRELGPELQDISMADLNPRSLVRKHLLEPVDLDDLDDRRDG
jgi:sec-independent protein translocase protein TatB